MAGTALRRSGRPRAGGKRAREGRGRSSTLAAASLGTVFLVASVASYFFVISSRLDVPNLFVAVSILALQSFLVILIVRYILLIWFAYLDRLEYDGAEDAAFQPPVSIIVPAYNEARVIDASLAALLRLRYPRYEVIVVDDGSTDGTYGRARRWGGQHGPASMQVLRQVNGGKARALNAGIRRAMGEIVVCIDADSQLAAGSLAAMVRHFRDPAVGGVAGNVKVKNRRNVLAGLQALEYLEGLNMVRRTLGFFRIVNIIPGPVGAFRRSALEQIGGYDPDTFAEDCDLTVKLLTRGWKIRYEPRAVSWTEAPERINDLVRQRYRWTRGLLQVAMKHRRFLFSFRGGAATTFVMWYLCFESIIWPAMNVFGNAFLFVVASAYGFSAVHAFWWAQLTLLDLVAAFFCVALERESLALVLYSVVYRLSYILALDVCKVLAGLDEMLGTRMVWGKLERIGA